MDEEPDLELTKAVWRVTQEIRNQADEGLFPDSTKMIFLNILKSLYHQADPDNDWDLDIG